MRIRTQIFGAVLLIVAAAGAAMTWRLVETERAANLARLQANIAHNARLIGVMLADPLQERDVARLQASLDALFTDPEMTELSLRGAGGSIELARRRAPEAPGGTPIDSRVPIVRDGQALGEVLARYSTAPIERQLRESRYRLLAGAALLALVLAGASTLLARRLTVPIERLTAAARAIADGVHDREIRAEGAEELRALGAGFVRMRDAVRAQMDRLAQNNRELEQQIAQRRVAEQERDRLISVIDATPDFVGTADPQGLVTYVNRAGRAVLGYLDRPIAGVSITSLHPAWANDVIRQIGIPAAIRDGVWSGETAVIDKEGHEIPVAQIILSHVDADGRLRFLSTVMRDISERRRAEAALRTGEERLRQAIRASRIGIFDHDHVAGTLYWSPEIRERYGWGSERDVGIDEMLSILHPEDRERIGAAIRRSHDPAGDGEYEVTYRVILRNGEIAWIDARGQTYFEGEGANRHPVRTVGATVDITQRRRAEEALRVSEERLRQAIRVADIGIFDHDQRTDAIYWSPEQRRTYGVGADDTITLQVYLDRVFPEDLDRIGAAVMRAHDPAGDGLFDVEHRIIRRDGAVRWLTTRAQTFFEGSGAARRPVRTVGAVADITERKQVEERVRALNDTLEQRVRERTADLARAAEELVRSEKLAALGRMVAGVAHELNTPIGNSLLVVTTLDEATRGLQQALQQGLRRAVLESYLADTLSTAQLLQRNLQRAGDLITSFKQVAVDQASAQRREFLLDEIVAENVMTLQPSLRGTPHRIETAVAPDIRMDSFPGPLGQVLTNLVNNAVLHAFDGRSAGTVRIEAQPDGADAVTITVTDDGIGITPEHQRRIFDPFFTTRLGRGGSGLGLNIVHNLVTDVLGGTIDVDSDPDAGTAFTMVLPLVAPRPVAKRAPAA
jgi:PAS domain S-box-containing protein